MEIIRPGYPPNPLITYICPTCGCYFRFHLNESCVVLKFGSKQSGFLKCPEKGCECSISFEITFNPRSWGSYDITFKP